MTNPASFCHYWIETELNGDKMMPGWSCQYSTAINTFPKKEILSVPNHQNSSKKGNFLTFITIKIFPKREFFWHFWPSKSFPKRNFFWHSCQSKLFPKRKFTSAYIIILHQRSRPYKETRVDPPIPKTWHKIHENCLKELVGKLLSGFMTQTSPDLSVMGCHPCQGLTVNCGYHSCQIMKVPCPSLQIIFKSEVHLAGTLCAKREVFHISSMFLHFSLSATALFDNKMSVLHTDYTGLWLMFCCDVSKTPQSPNLGTMWLFRRVRQMWRV